MATADDFENLPDVLDTSSLITEPDDVRAVRESLAETVATWSVLRDRAAVVAGGPDDADAAGCMREIRRNVRDTRNTLMQIRLAALQAIGDDGMREDLLGVFDRLDSGARQVEMAIRSYLSSRDPGKGKQQRRKRRESAGVGDVVAALEALIAATSEVVDVLTTFIADLDGVKQRVEAALEHAREGGLEVRDGQIIKPTPPPGLDSRG